MKNDVIVVVQSAEDLSKLCQLGLVSDHSPRVNVLYKLFELGDVSTHYNRIDVRQKALIRADTFFATNEVVLVDDYIANLRNLGFLGGNNVQCSSSD